MSELIRWDAAAQDKATAGYANAISKLLPDTAVPLRTVQTMVEAIIRTKLRESVALDEAAAAASEARASVARRKAADAKAVLAADAARRSGRDWIVSSPAFRNRCGSRRDEGA